MRRSLVVPLALLVLGGCTAERVTEIVGWVDSDLTVPGELDQLRFWVAYVTPAERVVDQRWSLDPQMPEHIDLPARIALMPGAKHDRAIHVTVQGLKNGGPVLDREAELSFATDRILFLRASLLRRCVGVTCAAGQTCGEQGCEPVLRSARDLPDYAPELERWLDVGVGDAVFEGAPADARAPDGG